MPEVFTANALRSGTVVYLDANGRWSEALDQAAVAETPALRQHLEKIATAAVERNEVTAVYAFAVNLVGGRAEPRSVRERIRAAHAPTV